MADYAGSIMPVRVISAKSVGGRPASLLGMGAATTPPPPPPPAVPPSSFNAGLN